MSNIGITGNKRNHSGQTHLVLYTIHCYSFGYSAASYLPIACTCLKPAGFVPGSPLHVALFLGAPSPQKNPNKLGTGLNEVVHLGTGGRLPTFLFTIF
jgi:hypothetical protein